MYRVFKTETVAFEGWDFLVNGEPPTKTIDPNKVRDWLETYMGYVEIDVKNKEVDVRNEGICQGLLMAMGYRSAHAQEIVDVWKEQVASRKTQKPHKKASVVR